MAYKCRAYPTPEQASVLNRTFGCVRVVWNRTLAWRHARYYGGEQAKTNFAQANAYLTAMKTTEELAWLNEVSSVPLQQAIRHQQVAYANFFAGRARSKPGTAPWRRAEASRLIAFGRAAALPDGGFGWLGVNGEIDVTVLPAVRQLAHDLRVRARAP